MHVGRVTVILLAKIAATDCSATCSGSNIDINLEVVIKIYILKVWLLL